MEEADAVSDVIYILDHGKVQCSGTPLDLKTQFGTGYTLNVVVKENGKYQLLLIYLQLQSTDNFKFIGGNGPNSSRIRG